MTSYQDSLDLPERISEEILACKVCFLRYEPSNLPKLLACSHTFCHNCIVDYLKSKKVKNKSRFPCPLCRKETTVANGLDGVKSLPNNYTVLDLMDMVDEPQGQGDLNIATADNVMVQRSAPEEAQRVSFTPLYPSLESADLGEPIPTAPISTHPVTTTALTNTTATSPPPPPPPTRSNKENKESNKCCRCGQHKGVFAIKCEHKICKNCKKKDKKMDSSVMVPCQLCLGGVEMYAPDEPPPYCEHEEDRPPAYNPNAYASGPVETAPPIAPTDGYGAQTGYVNPHHHAGGIQGYPGGVQPVIQNGSVPGYTQNATHGVSEDMVSRLQINENMQAVNIDQTNQAYQTPMAVNMGYIPAQYGQYPQGQPVQVIQDQGQYPHVQVQPVQAVQVQAQYAQGQQVQIQPQSQQVQGQQQVQSVPAQQVQSQQPQGHSQTTTSSVATHPVSQMPTHVVGKQPATKEPSIQPTRTAPTSPPQNTAAAQDNQESNPHQARAMGGVPSTPHTYHPEQQARATGGIPKPGSQTGGTVSSSQQGGVAGGVPVMPGAVELLRQNLQSRIPQGPPSDSNGRASSGDPTPRGDSPVQMSNSGKKRPVPAVPQKAASNSPRNSQVPNRSSPVTTSQSPSQGQVPLAAAPAGPKVPPRRLLGEPQGLPFKCVNKFGRYSETKMQSGAFEKPTRVSVSDNGGNIVVTDAQAMTVQIFTSDGDYTYMFKVLGIQGACIYAQDKLAVGTHRGVEIYNISGYKETEFPIGSVLNTVPYKYGFIAVKQKSLVFFGSNLTQTKELSKKKLKSSFKKSIPFENIRDVAVSMSKDIIVLEGPSGEMSIIDDEGVVKSTIQPQNESCGKLLDPYAITFDRWANIFVSDLQSRKVLRFSPNGRFSRCMLNFTLGETSTPVSDLKAYGLSASAAADHLITVIGGATCAEIRIYKLY